jgi:hypothetical protein
MTIHAEPLGQFYLGRKSPIFVREIPRNVDTYTVSDLPP